MFMIIIIMNIISTFPQAVCRCLFDQIPAITDSIDGRLSTSQSISFTFYIIR
ncbi:hypothetical protein V6Z12_A11G320600 [Gossypium hirsutum]